MNLTLQYFTQGTNLVRFRVQNEPSKFRPGDETTMEKSAPVPTRNELR